MQKLRITKTLLDSYLWVFKKDDGYEEFLRTLNRQKSPPTTAQLNGLAYENVLNNVLKGEHIPKDHEWYKPVMEMAIDLWGSQQQVTLFQEITVDGITFLLHGVLDYLIAGHIYDCKFTKNYHLNKYFWEDTTQTSMYLALVPEALDFTYIISDGTWVYRERYPRDIVPPIENYIKNFKNFLIQHGLWETYVEIWRVQE